MMKVTPRASLARLLPLTTAIAFASIALPAQAYDDECKPPKTSYAQVYCTDDDKLFVAHNKDYQPQALINKQGKVLANLKGYENVDQWSMQSGYFAVQKNGKVGYMTTQGKLVVPTIYDDLQDPDDKYDETWANSVRDGRIIVRKNGKFGIIDTANKVILPFNNKYDYIDEFSEGMAAVASKAGKWGFINLNGKEVIATQYDYLNGNFGGYYGFTEGLVSVAKDKKWGFITKTGKVAVPFIYDEARPFSEGLAGVLKNGNWGFIDGANKTVIPFQYADKNVERYSVNYMAADHFNFYDGKAIIGSYNGEYVCINKAAKKVACD